MAEWIRNVKDNCEKDKKYLEAKLSDKEAHGERTLEPSERSANASPERLVDPDRSLDPAPSDRTLTPIA